MSEAKKGTIKVNERLLNRLGVNGLKKNDEVEVFEIREKSFVEVKKNENAPVLIPRNLVEVREWK